MTLNNTIQFSPFMTVCLPLVVDLWGNDHLVLLLSLQHLFAIDAITKAVDFVFLLVAEAAGRWILARDVYRLRVRSGEPMMTLGSRTKAHTWNENTGIKKCISTEPNGTTVRGILFIYVFCWSCISLQTLGNSQLDELFHTFICSVSLHVSSVTPLIIRRSNCINTSSGMISLCK